MGIALMVLGYIIAAVGGIWLLVVAFKTSIGWGLASLFIPFAGLVFVFTHWDDAKKPFFINLCGIPFIVLGIILAAQSAGATP